MASKKFTIWYDVGFGREEEEVEADSLEEAEQQAYEAFSEACEGQHSWGVEEAATEAGEGEAEAEEPEGP
jgi:hypothetical protein